MITTFWRYNAFLIDFIMLHNAFFSELKRLLSFITFFFIFSYINETCTNRLSFFISIHKKSFLIANKTIFVTCICTLWKVLFHTTLHIFTLCNLNYYSKKKSGFFSRVYSVNSFCLKMIKSEVSFSFRFKQISCILCVKIWSNNKCTFHEFDEYLSADMTF